MKKKIKLKKKVKTKSKTKTKLFRKNPGGGWKFSGTFASKWDAFRQGMGSFELRDKKTREWYLVTGRIDGNNIFVEKVYPTPIKSFYNFTGVLSNDWIDWRMGFDSEMVELENKKHEWWTADAEVLRSRIKTMNVLNIFRKVEE